MYELVHAPSYAEKCTENGVYNIDIYPQVGGVSRDPLYLHLTHIRGLENPLRKP